jgi:uncharacterized peroxidase-related enzyme
MSLLPLLKEENATGDVAQTFADIRRRLRFPFVPNFFKAQVSSPNVLASTWFGVNTHLVGGTLPRALKEMIFVAVSAARNCEYCAVVHLALCKTVGVDEEMMDALVHDLDALMPQRTRDIVKFAVKCSQDPIRLSAEDFEKVRQHGLSDLELMEIVGMAAMATYCDIIADALKVEVDEPVLEILGGTEQVAQRFPFDR